MTLLESLSTEKICDPFLLGHSYATWYIISYPWLQICDHWHKSNHRFRHDLHVVLTRSLNLVIHVKTRGLGDTISIGSLSYDSIKFFMTICKDLAIIGTISSCLRIFFILDPSPLQMLLVDWEREREGGRYNQQKLKITFKQLLQGLLIYLFLFRAFDWVFL